jgi:hypothetical protein
VPALALLCGATLAAIQFALATAISPAYDVTPMANAVRTAQEQGRVVANFATYHNQYQFAGRLRAPLVEVRGGALDWLAAHPQALAVVYLDDMPADRTGVRFFQRYRGGVALLLDAKNAARLVRGAGGVAESAPETDAAGD